MAGEDRRQTQDERTREREPEEDAREEYTTYRETNPEKAEEGGDAAARREADLQPAPTREGGDADQESRRRPGS
jgi:hypothetical protein